MSDALVPSVVLPSSPLQYATAAYKESGIKCAKLPPYSPDLSPSKRDAAGGLGAGEGVSGARPERCVLGERQPQCRYDEDGVFHATAHGGGRGGKGRHDPVLR